MKRIGKKKKLAPECILEQHLKQLNLKDPLQYTAWCKQHGFSPQLVKHRKERDRELEWFRTLATKQNRAPEIVPRKGPMRLLIDYCEGKSPESPALPYLNQLAVHLKDTGATLGGEAWINRAVMLELLKSLDSHKCRYLLEPMVACSRLPASADNTFLAGLGLLAAHRSNWLRPLASWHPPSYNPRRQFSSLFHHLLDRHYEIPECFVSAWFEGRSNEAAQFRRWSLALGSGLGLRGCDVPVTYSKKLWQSLRQAPNHLLVIEALRWAQVISLGGTPRLADALLATRLGRSFEHGDFWTDVLKWFVENPFLDIVHVGPIIDYLHEQRFVPVLQDGRNGLRTTAPRQPNLTMKGRSVEGLLRSVAGWHKELSYSNDNQKQHWPSTGIRPLLFEEGDPSKPNYCIWRIRELLSQEALLVEGRKLRHCVASYGSSCKRGETSIWTLELQSHSSLDKLLTVEVRPVMKQIIQARGRCNRMPSQLELNILQRWANHAGLKLRL